nr:hypothetical protein [Tanacetum cinerariifolium]
MVDDDDDETSKDKEIDKLIALISLSFKKIYKPTNNNLRTSINTSRANQDNSPRIQRNAGYEHQRLGNVAGARETVGMYKIHTKARTSKLPQDSKKTNKRVSFSTGVISTTSVSRPQLKSNPQGDRVLRSNSSGKKLEVEEHRRNVKLPKNKTSVTACNDSLNAKTLNVKSVSAMCDKRANIKIVEWHNYKHLDWITVRRDDDKLHKFKEGNFKRLRIQDIEDMLLLLVQGKLANLTIEERFAFNISLRMFTRSIVIQRRVEDLQLGVKSDGTLINVRISLDDRLKGIRMKYLSQSIWRKSDKDKAAVMIQAIDKMLKNRRIRWSLERFVGGRLYEGDFRMLQRTI